MVFFCSAFCSICMASWLLRLDSCSLCENVSALCFEKISDKVSNRVINTLTSADNTGSWETAFSSFSEIPPLNLCFSVWCSTATDLINSYTSIIAKPPLAPYQVPFLQVQYITQKIGIERYKIIAIYQWDKWQK